MTTVMLLRTGCALLAAVTTAVVLSPTVHTSPAKPAVRGDGGPEPLFTFATSASSREAPGASREVPDMARHTVRRATLVVSEKALAAGVVMTAEAHVLNLFPDVSILAMRNRVESRSSRDYSWFGTTPDDESGRVIIAVVNGKLGAVINHKRRRYVVQPTGDRGHEVLEIDQWSFEEGDDTADLPDADRGRARPRLAPNYDAAVTPIDTSGVLNAVSWQAVQANADALRGFDRMGDDGRTIDVMVVYTHGAAYYSNPLSIDSHHQDLAPHAPPYGLLTNIQLAIDVANQTFEDSGILTRLNMIGPAFEETRYQEDGIMSIDLWSAIRGELQNVHDERDLRAADLVIVVTSHGTFDDGQRPACGMARVKEDVVRDHQASGYVVVRGACLSTGYTLAHEVGHSLGAEHDWTQYLVEGQPNAVPQFAHGFVLLNPADPSHGVRTIMAYGDLCPYICVQIGRWSNPGDTTQYGLPLGRPLGVPQAAYDVKILNDNRVAVSSYRTSWCRTVTTC